jgi:hypothetical protein
MSVSKPDVGRPGQEQATNWDAGVGGARTDDEALVTPATPLS